MKHDSFIGRRHYLEQLESCYYDDKANLILIYGRRRVGKSRLIHEFVKNKKYVFRFTGVEVSTSEKNYQQIQLNNFLSTLSEITKNDYYKNNAYRSWEECFNQLNNNLPPEDSPCCIVLDEFPWMAGQRLTLVRVLFKFWELKWSSRDKLMLIICGSSVGFLDKHFINSTQFYGRASLFIHLHPLSFFETTNFFSRSRLFEEILEFYMIFGGIPKYLEQIPSKDSVRKTINQLCFTSSSFFIDEVPHLLSSSFIRESGKYETIIQALTHHNSLNYDQIALKTRSIKGSSLKYLLENLIHSDIIEKYTPTDRFKETNLFRFRLGDEFMRFYYSFMIPSINLIRKNVQSKDIYDIIIPQKLYYSWKGRAFERIIQKHALEIADKIGIGIVVKSYGSYFVRNAGTPRIDLIYFRTDKTITVCEIKYSERPFSLKPPFIHQIQKQKEFLEDKFRGKRIEHYLITNGAVTESVKNSGFFNRIIQLPDLLS